MYKRKEIKIMDNKDKAMLGAILPIIIIPVIGVILINLRKHWRIYKYRILGKDDNNGKKNT